MFFLNLPLLQVTVQGDSWYDQDSEQEQGQQWDQNYSSMWWRAPRPITHLHYHGRDGYDKSTRKQNTPTTP